MMIEPPGSLSDDATSATSPHSDSDGYNIRSPFDLRIPYCPIPILLAIVVGVVLRVAWLGDKPLWEDEAWTFVAAVSDQSLADTVGADPHPFSFYWACRQWPAWLFATDFAFRLPHALCSCLALVLFPLVLKRLGIVDPLMRWCVMVFALLPLNVRYAQEARAYALCQLAGMLVLLAYLECMRRPRIGSVVSLFLATALSTHIDGFGWITPFVVILHAIAMGFRATAPRRAMLAVGLGMFAAIPYALFRYRLIATAGELHTVGSGRLFKALSARWLELSPVGVAFDAVSPKYHLIIWLVAAVAALVIFVGAATTIWQAHDRRRWLPPLLFFVPIAGLLAMSMLTGQILIFKKYLIPVAPAAAILFCIGLIRITRGSSISALLMFCIVPLGVSIVSNMRAGDRADWRGVYKQMRPLMGANDLFVQQRHLNYPLYSFGPLRAYAWRDGNWLDESRLIEFDAPFREEKVATVGVEYGDRSGNPNVDPLITGVANGAPLDFVWTLTTDWMADDRMPDLAEIATRERELEARGVRAVRWKLRRDGDE